MRLNIVKSSNAEQLYIIKSFRNDKGKSTSKIFKKLPMASLLPEHDNNRDKVIVWAKEQARIYTEAEKNNELKIPIELSEGAANLRRKVNLRRRLPLSAENISRTWSEKDLR